VQGYFGTLDTIMHSMVMQWAFASARAEGLVAKESKIEKITLIDDILAALTASGTDISATVESIAKFYRKLGLEPDVVKTLAGMTKGHFLNRLYTALKTKRVKVITAAKIFAKADREHDRKLVTVWESDGPMTY
jgi:hypothetical protein